MSSYRLCLWSECLSPMTHMKGVEGNEAMIARQEIDTPAGKRSIPCLSSNAIRHRLVRDPGGLWLIEVLGLKGKLSLQQLNMLLHGGNLTESTGREDTARIAEMQEILPLLRLMGCSLPDQILNGSLMAWDGLLVCEENRGRLRKNLPDGFELPAESLKPAEHYVGAYQSTRGDAARRVEWYDETTRDPEAKSNLMIFSGQQVIPGAVFSHGFLINHGSELELGCLLHSLTLWQEQGGTIGGMASKGHGRLATVILGDLPNQAELIERYTKHVEQHAERCRAWLDKVFIRKKKPAKGQKAAANG